MKIMKQRISDANKVIAQKIVELDPKQLIGKRDPDLECQVCFMIA